MRRTVAIFTRELTGSFAAPPAQAAIAAFPVLAGFLTFWAADFFARGQADLQPFFAFHPFLYLVLVPALSARLWAGERAGGTLELLLTLPLRRGEAIIGKFLAAWCVAGLALGLTFPMWLTVNFLGRPDNGAILAGYIGSWLMAGAMLAIGAAVSAATRDQFAAFVVTAALLFGLIGAGTSTGLALFGWAAPQVIDAVMAASPTRHFAAISSGVIALRDLAYFASTMIAFLGANAILVGLGEAD